MKVHQAKRIAVDRASASIRLASFMDRVVLYSSMDRSVKYDRRSPGKRPRVCALHIGNASTLLCRTVDASTTALVSFRTVPRLVLASGGSKKVTSRVAADPFCGRVVQARASEKLEADGGR